MNKKLTVIGERINAAGVSIRKAIENKDEEFIIKEAELQIKWGVDFLDINCSSMADAEADAEIDGILWILEKILDKFDNVGICIDTSNPEVVRQTLPVCRDRKVIVNSITAEAERIESMLPLIKKYDTKVIALTMDSNGMPQDVEGRLNITRKLLDIIEKYNIPKDKIYIDPLVRPLSIESQQASKFIAALIKIKESFDLNVVSGISNISYGLPRRHVLNAFFLNLCIYHGLDAAIIDPSQKLIQSAIRSTYSILGQDSYCIEYIKAWREGRI